MKLECRFFTENDYVAICEWWKAHGWEPVVRQLLPPTGAVVYDVDSGKLYAASWLYLFKDCPGGMIEWTVTNPDNSAKESYKTIKKVIECLVYIAKTEGICALHTAVSAEAPALGRMMIKSGFVKTDENMTHYMMGGE